MSIATFIWVINLIKGIVLKLHLYLYSVCYCIFSCVIHSFPCWIHLQSVSPLYNSSSFDQFCFDLVVLKNNLCTLKVYLPRPKTCQHQERDDGDLAQTKMAKNLWLSVRNRSRWVIGLQRYVQNHNISVWPPSLIRLSFKAKFKIIVPLHLISLILFKIIKQIIKYIMCL